MPVLTKVMVGEPPPSRSKKSALRRWASRPASPVSTDARFTVATTCDCSGFSATSSEPEKSVKRPRTLVIMRWRATNPTVEWAGSTVQVPGARVERSVMGCSSKVGVKCYLQLDCKLNYSTKRLRCQILTMHGVGYPGPVTTERSPQRAQWLDDEEMGAWR